ncbi:MAG: CNNM domain-containing protein, partial [Flavobacteriaceae bacterium]|nr:CNNM domain-containing protein [Flavobacteriaceae bacterium]
MTTGILVILFSLILSAFFSGMEIAYVSSNKVHIEIEKRQSGFMAGILKSLTAKPSMFIASMIIGNNIALVVYGFYMGDLLTYWLSLSFQHLAAGFSGILVKTIISTLVILLTAEFLPKVFFQIYANNLLKFFALPAYFFHLLFYWVSRFVISISDATLKLFSKHSEDEVRLSFSKVELGNYINEQLESSDEEEQIDSEIHIFQNALDFARIKAREAMVPRTEIVAVDIETNPKELIKRFSETGLSKILVYEENIDDVTGYVHSFDLFNKPESIKA